MYPAASAEILLEMASVGHGSAFGADTIKCQRPESQVWYCYEVRQTRGKGHTNFA